jgi:citrate lyase subunit alpha / citrate CoA-transferase
MRGICKMLNKIGREIPEELLKERKAFEGTPNQDNDKIVPSIREAIIKCGLKDGMAISFHHHFRDGDYVVNMVVEEIAKLGIKDITICASSLGDAHDPIGKYIEDGTITGIQTSGVRGKIGEAISTGKLKKTAIIRSHGGRVRAIEEGEVHIDVAFIGAPTSDPYGNARGIGGKSDCGVLSYSMVDAEHADKVVIITDCLVDYPNFPPSIQAVDVDYVVVVDQIGNPKKIVSNIIRLTNDPRELRMADYCTRVMVNSPFFKDGFSFQTGGGGAALAVNLLLRPYLEKAGYKMSFALGGITKPMCDLLDDGFVNCVVNAQAFDAGSIESIKNNPRHFEISTSQYANPRNKGALVNKLDFVILGALEVDTDFNVNVVTGSDGILRGAPGGHPDTAAGSKCSIIVAPLIRSRIPTICDRVVTVTTPGEVVDVVVTDYGIAINPLRTDLIEALKISKLPIYTIEELRDMAYEMCGKPEQVEFEDQVVAIMESRDGSILDVVRKPKAYEI